MIGEPDATIVLAYRDITNQLKKPFADMFWDIWAQQGYSLPQDRNQYDSEFIFFPLELNETDYCFVYSGVTHSASPPIV